MKNKDSYLDLAYRAIKNFIIDGIIINLPKNSAIELSTRKAGVFVSLHDKNTNDLMGCIGTYQPTQQNIGLEIINNAISAATADPRFLAISEKDLSRLSVSVDILSPLEKINDQRGLDPKKYGIYIKTDDQRSALLLPKLSGVDTIAQQLSITRQKGGIGQNEPVTIYRFIVERHE